MNALSVLCAQLMRDLFAIAKFLYSIMLNQHVVVAIPNGLFPIWHSDRKLVNGVQVDVLWIAVEQTQVDW